VAHRKEDLLFKILNVHEVGKHLYEKQLQQFATLPGAQMYVK
jgi:hypothetical protein